jgi:hypothetical protein
MEHSEESRWEPGAGGAEARWLSGVEAQSTIHHYNFNFPFPIINSLSP